MIMMPLDKIELYIISHYIISIDTTSDRTPARL